MAEQREGYWLNAKTGTALRIDEHRRWISQERNARAIGLAPAVFAKIPRPNSDRDRLRVLLTAMHGGLIRIRRHGAGCITFEFTLPMTEALQAVAAFLDKEDLAGEETLLTITNLAMRRGLEISRRELREMMRRDGAESLAGEARLVQLSPHYPEEDIDRVLAALRDN